MCLPIALSKLMSVKLMQKPYLNSPNKDTACQSSLFGFLESSQAKCRHVWLEEPLFIIYLPEVAHCAADALDDDKAN